MAALAAVLGAVSAVVVPRAVWRAWHQVTVLGAGGRVIASVSVAGPLELPADLDRARVKVDVLPAEPDRLRLPYAHRQRDRPASPVAAARGRREDTAGLIAGQRLDIDVFADGRVDQAGYIAANLAALPGNLSARGTGSGGSARLCSA